jgi:hypothetical protein
VAAFSLESESRSTASNIRALFGFISDFKNFGSILPADKVQDFEYSENKCSFTIKGITAMTVTLNSKTEFDHILFRSQGLGKFDFSLHVRFAGEPDAPGSCSVKLSGDINPFILSMAKNQLQGLVDTMALRLSELAV